MATLHLVSSTTSEAATSQNVLHLELGKPDFVVRLTVLSATSLCLMVNTDKAMGSPTAFVGNQKSAGRSLSFYGYQRSKNAAASGSDMKR